MIDLWFQNFIEILAKNSNALLQKGLNVHEAPYTFRLFYIKTSESRLLLLNI